MWAAHCCNESGVLDEYAAAMHRLAADIWPQNNAETRIEWCYNACMDYFFGGGLKRIRDKVCRRQKYQHHAADAEDMFSDCGRHSLSCVEPANAVSAVETTKSARSSFTV